MRLVGVYDEKEAPSILYALLRERPPEANISHKVMPSWQEHKDFINSVPYAAWYLIELDEGVFIGAIYLTRWDEIGLSILAPWQHQGHGPVALRQLMALHPRDRYLANVAPANYAGQAFWIKQGFKAIQVTYELSP